MKENTTASSPLKWIPTAYFAMGLPFIVLSLVSVLMYQDLGVSKTQITFWLSLITLPWTLKPLWSPFLELFKTKRFFVILTQMITGITFTLIAFSLHLPDFFQISIALMGFVAISGATHDIALDGIYLSALSAKVQAQYIGWQGAFYNAAKLLSYGGLVYVAGMLKNSMGALNAWTIIMLIFAAIMIGASIYHMASLPKEQKRAERTGTAKETYRELVEIIVSFFRKKYIWIYILFIILYRSAEGLAMKVLPLFLGDSREVGGLGLLTEQIGIVNGICGALAFVTGSILGGYYISRFGLKKTLFSLCCAFNIPFVIYLLFAIYQPSSLITIGAGVTFEWFGYGFGFVGLTLFMMQQVAPGKHQMAHYAFASGIMNLGVLIPGAISGYLADQFGYEAFFTIVLVAAIPAFIVTALVPFTYNVDVEKNNRIMKNLKIMGDNQPNMPWEDKPADCKTTMWRYSNNPIIPRDLLPTSNSIFNSAVVPFGDGYAGVFRCDDTNRRMRLHVGFSDNAIDWNIEHEPLKFDCEDKEIGEWVYGYDPRVCFIEDRYYITWCNGYHGPTIGVAYTFDFKTFTQLENAFLPFNRNGVMFPRKINGNFAMVSRPSDNGHTPFGDIFYSESPDLEYWGRHRHVMSPSAFEVSAWQCTKIGAGPIPIETSEGWLMIYHGVLASCNGFVYSFGSALLDIDEPWKVKYRSGPYLISPQKDYECMGDVPNVCFPCASIHDPETGRIAVYYGCADTVTSLAFGYIDEIIEFTKQTNILK